MNDKTSSFCQRFAVAGSLTGVLILLDVQAVMAQAVVTVKDFHRSAKTYVGNGVQITGLSYNIRQELKKREGRNLGR